MIRATVNLTTSAMLISVATSLKLPLSTTYVCFMVAMGSSLADKAWGRESAVYRISGVMTVVAGWFITAVGGFLIALAMGLILIYGGIAAFVVTTLLCGYMLVKSNFFKKNKAAETAAVKAAETGSDIIYNITQEVCATMERTTRIYDRTLIAVFKENRKVLREWCANPTNSSTSRANASTPCCPPCANCRKATSIRLTTTCRWWTI